MRITKTSFLNPFIVCVVFAFLHIFPPPIKSIELSLIRPLVQSKLDLTVTKNFRKLLLRSNVIARSSVFHQSQFDTLPLHLKAYSPLQGIHLTKAPKLPSKPVLLSGALLATAVAQYKYGKVDDYYEYRFITKQDPDDLAGFYGSEEFMDLFCVFPIIGSTLMRGGYFDDEARFHTYGLPGHLIVSMDFTDKVDKKTRQTVEFKKHEAFENTIGNRQVWQTVMNFGFKTLADGSIECYHHGEVFQGNVPPLSLIMQAVFRIHAKWVAWATQHHLNHHAFHSETEREEEIEELSRKFMPLHLLKHHAIEGLFTLVFKAPPKGT